jgi:hypothetical protein
VDTDPGIPRRPGDIRNTPPHGFASPAATPAQGTPVHPAASPAGPGGAPIPPGAPAHPIMRTPVPPGQQPYAGPGQAPGGQTPAGQAPGGGTPPHAWGPVPASPPQTGPQAAVPGYRTGPQAAVPRSQTGPQVAVPRTQTGPQPAVPGYQTGPQRAVPGSQTGPQAAVPGSRTGPQAAVPRSQTGPQPAVPGYQTGPQRAVPHRQAGSQGPVRQPVVQGDMAWSGVPAAQDDFAARDVPRRGEPAEDSSTGGPMGARETSGVQVRLGSRALERQERNRRRGGRGGRRGGLIAGGVLVLAAAVAAGLLLMPRSGGDKGGGDGGPAPATAEQRPTGVQGRMPRTGTPIEVGTADGSKYRLAAVGGGVSDDGVVTTFQSSPPSGTSFAYIEYVLSNPTGHKVLLDFPGDVFVKRALVTKAAQGRCMPQAGVPEDMCTPPTQSQVVRRLKGGDLIPGDGGDKYLSPGASYLVRAMVDVPVARRLTRADMGLYVWKQLYMANQLARQVPFPSGGK